MRPNESAYTLLELMIVVLLMTIVAGLSIPRGWDLAKEYRLRGAAYYFRGLIRQVRSEAAAKGRYTAIVFDEVEREPVLSLYIEWKQQRSTSRGYPIWGGSKDPRLLEAQRLLLRRSVRESAKYCRYCKRSGAAQLSTASVRPRQDSVVLADRHFDQRNALSQQRAGIYLCGDRPRYIGTGPLGPIPSRPMGAICLKGFLSQQEEMEG